MPRNRISTSYNLQRIFVTLLYFAFIVFLADNFSPQILIATIIFLSVWLFTYLIPAKVEFDSSFMYVSEPGNTCKVGLEAVQAIDVAGFFGRQKSYRIKYIYLGKELAVKFSARILLTNFEDFCKAVRSKNPKVQIELPYPLDNC